MKFCSRCHDYQALPKVRDRKISCIERQREGDEVTLRVFFPYADGDLCFICDKVAKGLLPEFRTEFSPELRQRKLEHDFDYDMRETKGFMSKRSRNRVPVV